jgi:hypothetical protein
MDDILAINKARRTVIPRISEVDLTCDFIFNLNNFSLYLSKSQEKCTNA